MIFAPDLAAKILDGTKTVTRRPVKLVPNLQADGWDSARDGMISMPCRYAVGKTYAVQPGRGERGIGRIRILSVKIEPLYGAEREAEAEGFPDAAAFFDRWRILYGATNFDLDQIVWRIEFELVAA